MVGAVYLKISGFINDSNLELPARARFPDLPAYIQQAILDDIAQRDLDECLNCEEVDSAVYLDDDTFAEYCDYVYSLVRGWLENGTLAKNFNFVTFSEYIESEAIDPLASEYYIGIENPIRDDLIGYDYVITTHVDLIPIAESFDYDNLN